MPPAPKMRQWSIAIFLVNQVTEPATMVPFGVALSEDQTVGVFPTIGNNCELEKRTTATTLLPFEDDRAMFIGWYSWRLSDLSQKAW